MLLAESVLEHIYGSIAVGKEEKKNCLIRKLNEDHRTDSPQCFHTVQLQLVCWPTENMQKKALTYTQTHATGWMVMEQCIDHNACTIVEFEHCLKIEYLLAKNEWHSRTRNAQHLQQRGIVLAAWNNINIQNRYSESNNIYYNIIHRSMDIIVNKANSMIIFFYKHIISHEHE